MAINFENIQSHPVNTGLPVIKVIGVGGGGGNVVNRMVSEGIHGVQYLAANTDVMVLNSSKADITIPLGSKITKGLGAGMKPEVGKMAAEEDIETIRSVLENTDLVFIAAGMGGGTGTGAAPVIAEIAREMKILTVGVVTSPFQFEGAKRAKIAEEGIERLREHVDTLMVIPNNKLLEIASPKTTMSEAFGIADDVLKQAIGGITTLINCEGVINLDFADLKTVMANKGRAIMGTGIATGDNRGLDGAKKAISSPLLSDTPISGATGVIINIVADDQFSLLDAQAAAEFIQNSADKDADVIFGLVNDPSKNSEVVITVIATGFDAPEIIKAQLESQHTKLRVIDSLKHRNIIKSEDQKEEEEDDDSLKLVSKPEEKVSEEEVIELNPDEVGLTQVESRLHYPDHPFKKDEPFTRTGNQLRSIEDLDIPAFMRNRKRM